MKLSVQVIVHPDEDTDTAPVVREVFTLDRDTLALDTLGLHLSEAKDLLSAVQETVVEHQVQRAVATQTPCPDCGRARRHKDTRTIVVRTLFGQLRLPSPRWWHCPCQDQPTRTFQPLAQLLGERTTPELAYLQARFAALVSYGITATLLAELLPLGQKLHPAVVRRHTQAVATRLEDELGEERFSFIDTCQADREELPRPDLPLVVGLDGGYVHSSQQRSRRDGWFEVIAGKAVPAHGRSTCFGYVQTYDTKPKRRLFEVLKSQGMQDNQQVTFLTDGGEDIRDLPCYLNPQAEHLLDWFHITMRITVMTNMAKSLRRAKHFGGGNLRPRLTCGSVLASGGRGRVEGTLLHGSASLPWTSPAGTDPQLSTTSPKMFRSPEQLRIWSLPVVAPVVPLAQRWHSSPTLGSLAWENTRNQRMAPTRTAECSLMRLTSRSC